VVAARLLRLSVSPSLRASPRCAAETRSERTSPLMRMGWRLGRRSSCALTCAISLDPDGSRCAAETRSGKDRGLMRTAETRFKRTSPLTEGGRPPTRRDE
jgi:hypothetical protein